jgi:hypothetical protein
VADDVFHMPRLARSELRFTILGVGLIAMSTLSYHYVRANEIARLTEETKYRRSFVIRRAMAARNVWESVSRRMNRDADAVVMVYGRSSGLDLAGWNNVNVVEAIGKGALLALLYDRPAMPVHFIPESSLPTIDRSRADVFFYDDFGNCYTVEEMTGDG